MIIASCESSLGSRHCLSEGAHGEYMDDNEIRKRNRGAVRTTIGSTVMAGLVLAGALIAIALLAVLTPTTQMIAPTGGPSAATGTVPLPR